MPRTRILLTTFGALLAASMVLVLAEQQVQFQTPTMPELPNNGLGETDQPLIPGQPWRIRDLNRPKPVTVTPAKHLGDPPSDAHRSVRWKGPVPMDGGRRRWARARGRGHGNACCRTTGHASIGSPGVAGLEGRPTATWKSHRAPAA